MKKLTYILSFFIMIVLIVSSCTQQPTPTPSTPTTPSNPSTPTSTMSASEAALKGKWYQKRTDISGTITNYTSPNYYFIFDSTLYTDNSGTTSRTGYKYTNSNTSVPAYTTWRTNSNGDSLIFQSPSPATMYDKKYKITLVTSDSLIIEQYGTGCSCTLKYHFHK